MERHSFRRNLLSCSNWCFFRMFSIKTFSKFILVEIRFDYGDIYFVAAPNSDRYLILFVPFWKMMRFETNWVAVFVANLHCFLPRWRSPAKAMLTRHYHCKTARKKLRNDPNIFIRYQHYLYLRRSQDF